MENDPLEYVDDWYQLEHSSIIHPICASCHEQFPNDTESGIHITCSRDENKTGKADNSGGTDAH